jgi:hypothetical protein
MSKRKNVEPVKRTVKTRKTTANKNNLDQDDCDDCDDCNDFLYYNTYTNFRDDENNENNENNLKLYIYETKCASPLCDHKLNPDFVPNITHREIHSINDLIEYGKLYHCKNFKSYRGIDLKVLFDLIQPLTELSNLIGMKEVKENMVNQI